MLTTKIYTTRNTLKTEKMIKATTSSKRQCAAW